MKMFNIHRFLKNSKEKRRHLNIIEFDHVELCAIMEMIFIGDVVSVVYAGGFDKYARIITDLDKFNTYRGRSYVKDICRKCSHYENGACKFRAMRGLE